MPNAVPSGATADLYRGFIQAAAGEGTTLMHRLVARVVSNQAVVDVALDAVVQTALRNSLDIDL